MIPTFPTFAALTLDHKAKVETITSQFEPYADFSFVNLFAWCLDTQTEVSLLNDNLVVRLPDYITGETTMYSFVGRNKVDESIGQILQVSESLTLVPEEVIQLLPDPSKYAISEERDNFDYMYDVAKLAAMTGKALSKKRNHVNRFLKTMSTSVSTAILTKLDQSTADECRAVFEQWAKECNKTDEECRAEYLAIDRLLRNADVFDLLYSMIRIDSKLCAFSITEVVPGGKAISHFEKSLSVHPSLYVFINYYTANELAARGVHTVNWQQDLDLPGLRHAKMSYHPTGFLKKYTVTKK
jgi:hypothetical protein